MAGMTVSQSDLMLKTGDIRTAIRKEAVPEAQNNSVPGVGNKSFTEMLSDSIKKVEDLQREADKSMIDLATGKTDNVHDTMIAVNKAEIAFQLMTQIRNKAIDAYKEIMRMQV